MPNKPKWVEALESAERVLQQAEGFTDVEQRTTLNALAHTYLAIAHEYRDGPGWRTTDD